LHGQNLAHGHLCPESFLVDDGAKFEKRVRGLVIEAAKVKYHRFHTLAPYYLFLCIPILIASQHLKATVLQVLEVTFVLF
jgi:hypothetical protein